jgi:three-Cys-motif partner protein
MVRGRQSSGGVHRFGGDWTEQKLQVLGKYLAAYVTALKNQPFHTVYMDAFAGTGYRTEREADEPGASLLFPDLAQDAPRKLLEGSAVLALQVEPPFSTYVFIEKSRKRVEDLEDLRTKHPDRQIDIRQGDANTVLRDICDTDWRRRGRRGVLFLDPYGMQVEWATIEAVARTQAIDMWLLFPLGIGVDRLIPRSGKIPEAWGRRLDLLYGTSSWRDHFYRVERTPGLFGDLDILEKASREVMGKFFVDRMKTVFPAVLDEPLVLSNSVGCPLYLFCFAAANPGGAPLALRIAGDLIKKMKRG